MWEEKAQALLSGHYWQGPRAADGRMVLTYSFAGAGSSFAPGSPGATAPVQPFSTSDRDALRKVLGSIEDVCLVRFEEVPDVGASRGALRFAYSSWPDSLGYAGYAYEPSAGAVAGEVWIGLSQSASRWDHYRPHLLLHETLHALGLQHPFEAEEPLEAELDTLANSVLSYSVVPELAGSLSRYPAEPMPADLVALQRVYGPSRASEEGTTYRLDQTEWRGGFTTLWDTGGHDTLDASSVRSRVSLDLQPEARSDVGSTVVATARRADGTALSHEYRETLAIGTGVWIEDAIGSSFDDQLRGNALDNQIWGGRGADRLWGREGNDTLHGGAGSDSIDGGSGIDTAVFSGRRSDWQFARDSQDAGRILVTQARETDTLQSIERLRFDDIGIALDLDGYAGQTVRLVGALRGPEAVANPSQVGEVLGWLDEGGSFEDAAEALSFAVLGAAYTNADLVRSLYRNVVGSEAPTEELATYLDLLDRGVLTRTGLITLAANSELNAQHVGLAGLWASGVAYMPG